MNSELAIYVELIERRLQLVQALLKALSESRRSMAALALADIDNRGLEQESICTELAFVTSEIASMQSRVSTLLGTDQVATNKERTFEEATAAAMRELTHASRVQAAVVKRSRRSIDVLMNVLSACTAEHLSGAYPAARYF